MRNLMVGLLAVVLCSDGCGENTSSLPSGTGGSLPQTTLVGGCGGFSPVGTDTGTGLGANNQTGGAMGTGGVSGGPDGGAVRLADVATLEMSWSTGMDAGSSVIDVVVQPDGTATCHESFGGNRMLAGRLDAPDAQLAAVLSSPGILEELVTACPVKILDAGFTIITTLATGERFSRLVFGTCSDDALASLVSALRRLGEACTHQAHPVDAL